MKEALVDSTNGRRRGGQKTLQKTNQQTSPYKTTPSKIL
jgi:hypothetical protein